MGELNTEIHAYNPSVWETEAGDSCEFEASLGYILSPKSARLQSETLSQKKQPNKKTKNKQNKTATTKRNHSLDGV